MKITAVKGFNDILPVDSDKWQFIEANARKIFNNYGFSEIRIPIVEKTEVFTRSIGEATDIVEKEMYTFSKGHDEYALRHEATPSVVRAYLHQRLDRSAPFQKYYYIGPMFRHERPQLGRSRQFSQLGVEALGLGLTNSMSGVGGVLDASSGAEAVQSRQQCSGGEVSLFL